MWRLPLAAAALGSVVLAGPSPASDPPDAAILAEFPFVSDEPNRIFVDLAPEGSARPLRLMLDTGASFSVATPRAAKALGIRVRRVKRDPYRRRTILGRDLQLYVDTTSSDTASKTGFEYALLGGNFLAHYVVELDFPDRRVRFIDPDLYRVPESVDAPGEAVLPLEIVANRPGLRLDFNAESSLVLIDTGAPIPFAVSGKLAQRAAIRHAPVPGLRIGSTLGPVKVEFGEARRVRLGPFEFEDAPVAVAPRGFYNLGFPGDAIVGTPVLAKFVVRLDYRRERIWLRRNPDADLTLETPLTSAELQRSSAASDADP